MLHSDRCEMFHASIFNLGLKSMCVIIFHTKLPTLSIEDSFDAPSLIEFWGIMIANLNFMTHTKVLTCFLIVQKLWLNM